MNAWCRALGLLGGMGIALCAGTGCGTTFLGGEGSVPEADEPKSLFAGLSSGDAGTSGGDLWNDGAANDGAADDGSLDGEQVAGEEYGDYRFSPDDADSYRTAVHQAEEYTASTQIRDVFFAFDSWALTQQDKQILQTNAEWIKDHPAGKVTIEGHCDERGTRAYNFVLAQKRAEAVRRYLVALGVSPERLIVSSLGKDRPFCEEPTAPCYQKNRRAHFVVGLEMASARP